MVPPGGSLSDDPEGDGPDAINTVTTNVITPVGGLTEIVASESTDPPAQGYGLVGLAVDITADPAADAQHPLVFVFRINASAIPAGDTAATITLFRNGVAVPNCTGPAGHAAPDPCVSLRQTLSDGDIQLTALTTAASLWSAGVPSPTLGPIIPSAVVVPINTSVSATATLTDAGSLGGHTKTWDWGDGTTSTGSIPAGATGTASVSGSHTYTAAGVHTVMLTVTDPSGQATERSFLYVVSYDPNGPFATGGGSIVPGGSSSDGGDLLPGIDGTSKANFGFVVKYKNGSSTVPSGNMTFNYSVGDFQLSSAAFDYLVVTNQNLAKFTGLATIKDAAGLYPFKVEARDAGSNGDRFTIKIWAPGDDPANDEAIYKASGDVQGQVTIHRK